jgi:hypothetical protein
LPPLQALLGALQAEQSRRPAPGAADGLDADALREALARLATLLEAADMEAMNAMAGLEDAFADTLGPRLEPLQAAMAQLDLGAALLHCQALQVRGTIPLQE